MDFVKLVTLILLVAGVLANCCAALAVEPAKAPGRSGLVLVSPGSKAPASAAIIPSGQLFGCPSGPITGLRTKSDSRFTAVLLGGRAIIGYQKSADSAEENPAETVFIECGKEIHRLAAVPQRDPAAAPKPEGAAPAPGGTGEISLAASDAAILEAQETAALDQDAQGEGRYAVPISASDLNLFLCDGTGPIALRLPEIPYVETGKVSASGSNPDAAYLTVNEAAFDGNGEYRSARHLTVVCGGVETNLQINPGAMPGQVVVIK
jgi:hypothetical protein